VVTVLQLAALGLGAYLLLWGLTYHRSAVAALTTNEFFIGSLVLGSLIAVAALYGIIAPLACRGQKDEHLKVFYVLALLLLLVFAAFCVLAMLNAHDAANLTTMLDYGWQKVRSAPRGG